MKASLWVILCDITHTEGHSISSVFFDGENIPTNTDHVEWIARHVPLSVSVASNVPGYEPAQCYITDGDSDKLVEEMMNNLIAISDAAYDSLLPLYVDVLVDLDARKHAWEEETKEAEEEEEEEAENGKKTVNPYKTLEKQLQAWLHQLPVLGFNSGRYDLNAIKKFFVPLLIHNNTAERASCFVIKRQNNFMCLSTDRLKFVDICNYLAPGVSYDKYLKAYGCELQKGHFPYEYMDNLRKLDDRVVPPQSAFFSRLKNEGISNDDYARCQAEWRDNGMETMRDYLIWYNNRDVTPFLEAISKQFAFYRDRDIDMFKDGISVPGLSLLHLFNDLPNDTFFTIFNQTNSDLHKLVKDNIVGGPPSYFTDITSRVSRKYGVARRHVARLRGTMPMPCTYGPSCKICLRVGICVVGRKISSVLNRHSRMVRWPSSG